jgi:hypothetical protein
MALGLAGASAIVAALAIVAACSGDDSTSGGNGGERQPCYRNGTCNAGLTCLSGYCVVVPDDGGGGADALVDGCLGGQASCSGVCTDLTTNSQHCGSCTIACAPDAVCVLGGCAADCPPPFVKCSGPNGNACLVACGSVDGGPIDAGPVDAPPPIDTGFPPDDSGPFDASDLVLLAPGRGHAIAVLQSNLYFSGAQTVEVVPIFGGLSRVLFDGGAWEVTADTASVYWDTNTGMGKTSINGGAITTLVSGYQIDRYAMDATYAYFASYTAPMSIYRVPLAGGPLQSLASVTYGGGVIAVDATTIYYAEGNPSNVYTLPIGGGTPALLAQLQGGVDSIAVDATTIYVGTTQGALLALTPGTDGGAPRVLGTEFGLQSIQRDGEYVYFVASGTGHVGKALVDGGGETILWKGNVPMAIAVDSTFMYWNDMGDDGGGIWRMPK